MENTNVTVKTEKEMNYEICINRSPEFFPGSPDAQ